jgi:lysozyme
VIVVDALIRRRSAEKALFLTPADGFIASPPTVLRPQMDFAAPALREPAGAAATSSRRSTGRGSERWRSRQRRRPLRRGAFAGAGGCGGGVQAAAGAVRRRTAGAPPSRRTARRSWPSIRRSAPSRSVQPPTSRGLIEVLAVPPTRRRTRPTSPNRP